MLGLRPAPQIVHQLVQPPPYDYSGPTHLVVVDVLGGPADADNSQEEDLQRPAKPAGSACVQEGAQWLGVALCVVGHVPGAQQKTGAGRSACILVVRLGRSSQNVARALSRCAVAHHSNRHILAQSMPLYVSCAAVRYCRMGRAAATVRGARVQRGLGLPSKQQVSCLRGQHKVVAQGKHTSLRSTSLKHTSFKKEHKLKAHLFLDAGEDAAVPVAVGLHGGQAAQRCRYGGTVHECVVVGVPVWGGGH